jgi:hypothetical protein
MRVIERREHARFAGKPGPVLHVTGEIGRQDLERDLAVERRVVRAEHLAHAAGANGGADFVWTDARAGRQGRHGVPSF